MALAEEKTQTHSLVSSLRDAVLVVNREGDVVLANRAMTMLLGRPEAEVLMRPAQELLGEGALAPLCEQLAAPVKDRTVKQLDIDEQSYMASIVTFRAEDGAALGRILTLSDISEVRRLATEKSRFIRMMVHELRSPLGSVKGVLEVLEDKSLGDDLEPYLQMVARADARIDGLTELISGLLSLSRIEETGKGEDAELVALAPLVEEALDVQREAMSTRQISAELSLAADLPRVLIAADDLRLVVSNLVGNAVKYNRDSGSVSVTAAVVNSAGDGDWLRFDVADTGLGIKQENLERIFTEFFREKKPETRELVGNGLGLAIVKRLVERAGGRLEVSSVEGEGSTFSVLLPA
jgi:signal transduction histidine kinase